ncbi:porin [Agaribacterium haliotis]|uniref:porin n=1 Tax=Agaribacterium haliotis TaxID=2013869 RepID=UPI000BB59DDD|nr:porin [Agaribacterium haliotis]
MKKTVLAIAVSAMAANAVADTTLEELQKRIDAQDKEIAELKKAQSATDAKVEATADAVESSSGSVDKSLDWAARTKIGGYGELHYNNFEGKDDKIDAHRFVLYIGHEFNEKVRFFSELELEHGLAGDGKPGEVELEQAYVEWDYAENHRLVAGQFLIPVGILNETHEPETFYGTERNPVEKNIIPVTWWEAGAQLRGEIAAGLSYDFAMHSGLKAADDEGNLSSIRSGRQKVANAYANDFAYTGRIKYTGVPGLELAATAQYQENLTQGAISDASATLFETHVIYNVAGFGLRALAAQWNIDGDAAKDAGMDVQNGWYIEPSYKVTSKLGFFARYNEWDNTAGADDSEAEEVIDYGLNFWLVPNVVFKADWSDDQNNDKNDSFNLGVGWSF